MQTTPRLPPSVVFESVSTNVSAMSGLRQLLALNARQVSQLVPVRVPTSLVDLP
jgi:hypothetical protein